MIKYKYQGLIIALLAITVLAACNRHTPAWEQMDAADGLMNTRPDSALALLEVIPDSILQGKEEVARYALMKSMALDKNYVDTTTFDVLQPAIDYYFKKGSPDERLRTYYYQGRIYQNRGDDDLAMQSFMRGREYCQGATDTLMMANLMVAQATIQYSIYKMDEFIKNNLAAARLYQTIGRTDYEVLSLNNVMDGCILTDNKVLIDSVMLVAQERVKQYPEFCSLIIPYTLSYALKFGDKEDIVDILNHYESMDSVADIDRLDITEAYCKIGDARNAKRVFDAIPPTSQYRSSLKYLAIKPHVLEINGDLAGALHANQDFSATIDSIHMNVFSHDLLFAKERHEMEKANLIEVYRRDRIIGGVLCGLFLLALLASWLYYSRHLNQTKRILAEKENENLILEQNNLRLLISQLESERDHLKELQKEQSELSKPIQDVIKVRLDMLNGLLAKEITNNDNYAKPYNKWLGSIRNDKTKFMDSTRLAFKASHPKFMEYIEQHGLTVDEINYLCLYAIGLRGKEVGEYIQMKSHYNISSEIRKKLAIDEHETNIGIYVRKLLKDFEV